jgi:hypothetical protein
MMLACKLLATSCRHVMSGSAGQDRKIESGVLIGSTFRSACAPAVLTPGWTPESECGYAGVLRAGCGDSGAALQHFTQRPLCA